MTRHELIMLAGIGVAFWLGWRQLELQRQILELQRTQAAPAIGAYPNPIHAWEYGMGMGVQTARNGL
jgi:hypothetical protein